MESAWRPALRPDLARLPPDAETGEVEALFDPVFNRRINLGPRSSAMMPLLDGTRSLSAVLSEAGAASAAEADAAFRSFLLLNLVEDAGAAVVARARAVQAQKVPLEPLILPDTRFGCQGSGDCCRNYIFGPLSEDDVARLATLPIEQQYPYLGPGPYADLRRLRDGSERHFLRTFGQQCIFQLPDERCGLHAAFGEAAKPGLCRLYPYQQVPTIFGRKIYDRSECATFATSAGCGTTLAAALPAVLALLPARVDLHHPVVDLTLDLRCDYGHFHALQEALCAALEKRQGRDAAGRLRLHARWLQAFVDGIGRCPLAPGEPDRTIAMLLSQPPKTEDGPPDLAAGLRALAAIAADLRSELLPHRIVVERAQSQRRAHQQLLDLDEALGALGALAASRAGTLSELPPRLCGLLDIGTAHDAAPAVDTALWLSLRSLIFSDRVLVEDRPAAGLLRAAFIQAVAMVRARQVAAARGAAHFGLADFNSGHSLALRILTQEITSRVFVQNEARAYEAAEAAAEFL